MIIKNLKKYFSFEVQVCSFPLSCCPYGLFPCLSCVPHLLLPWGKTKSAWVQPGVNLGSLAFVANVCN